MANTRNSNTIYVDTASNQVISDKNVKLAYVAFTSNGAGDSMVLRDGTVSGAIKLNIKNATADDTKLLTFDLRPIVFPNGIYVDTLDTGAVATLVTTSGENN